MSDVLFKKGYVDFNKEVNVIEILNDELPDENRLNSAKCVDLVCNRT